LPPFFGAACFEAAVAVGLVSAMIQLIFGFKLNL
jgi:hypothetical protein